MVRMMRMTRMTRTTSILSGITLATVLALSLPASAWAQRHREPAGGGGREASGGGGDHAVPRGDGGGGRTSSPEPATKGGGTADSAPRSSGADTSSGDRDQVPPFSRSRGSRRPVGTAVAREGAPPSKGGPIIIDGGYYGGYYPWGYGGLGFGGYYGGSYDPWYYGGYGYPSYYSIGYEGSLRLKVKPREGSVFVDGYFVGRVDEFDGIFQRLHVESGPHRVEIRADGYEPLTFEIRLQPGRTITYTGELKRLTP